MPNESLDVKAILATKVPIRGGHAMGTVAHHLLGDISSPDYDIINIYAETKDYYVGNWIYGFGFFDVLFPKDTVRALTNEEYEEFSKATIAIGSGPSMKLNIEPFYM